LALQHFKNNDLARLRDRRDVGIPEDVLVIWMHCSSRERRDGERAHSLRAVDEDTLLAAQVATAFCVAATG
jgi:hypothetical protein